MNTGRKRTSSQALSVATCDVSNVSRTRGAPRHTVNDDTLHTSSGSTQPLSGSTVPNVHTPLPGSTPLGTPHPRRTTVPSTPPRSRSQRWIYGNRIPLSPSPSVKDVSPDSPRISLPSIPSSWLQVDAQHALPAAPLGTISPTCDLQPRHTTHVRSTGRPRIPVVKSMPAAFEWPHYLISTELRDECSRLSRFISTWKDSTYNEGFAGISGHGHGMTDITFALQQFKHLGGDALRKPKCFARVDNASF